MKYNQHTRVNRICHRCQGVLSRASSGTMSEESRRAGRTPYLATSNAFGISPWVLGHFTSMSQESDGVKYGGCPVTALDWTNISLRRESAEYIKSNAHDTLPDSSTQQSRQTVSDGTKVTKHSIFNKSFYSQYYT